MKPIQKFFLQFSHFFTGKFLSLLLGFITFPILTRLLTKEQYGVLGLVTTTMLLAVAFAKAGLSEGIIRFYHDYERKKEEQTTFSSTIFFRGLIFAAIACILYILIVPYLKKQIEIEDEFTLCFMVMSIYLFFRPMNIIVLNILRVNGKTVFLNIAELAGKILSIILSLSIFIYIIRKLYGFFIGVVISEIAIGIVLFWWFFKHFDIKLDKMSGALSKKLLLFGMPLLFTEMIYLLLSYADRYMIAIFKGNQELGIYTVGYNLAMYISDMIIFSMSYAIVPIYVKMYNKEGLGKTEQFLSRSLYYLLIAIFPICLGYYAICKDLIIFLASPKYEIAASFSPIVLVGTITLGLNSLFNAGLYIKKKTIIIMMIMLIVVIENIILNLYMIPKYGNTGAAYATLIACVTANILTIIASFKYLKIRLNIKTLYIFGASVIMYIAVVKFDLFEGYVSIATKIILGVFIMALALLVIDKDIIISVIRIIKQRKMNLD